MSGMMLMIILVGGIFMLGMVKAETENANGWCTFKGCPAGVCDYACEKDGKRLLFCQSTEGDFLGKPGYWKVVDTCKYGCDAVHDRCNVAPVDKECGQFSQIETCNAAANCEWVIVAGVGQCAKKGTDKSCTANGNYLGDGQTWCYGDTQYTCNNKKVTQKKCSNGCGSIQGGAMENKYCKGATGSGVSKGGGKGKGGTATDPKTECFKNVVEEANRIKQEADKLAGEIKSGAKKEDWLPKAKKIVDDYNYLKNTWLPVNCQGKEPATVASAVSTAEPTLPSSATPTEPECATTKSYSCNSGKSYEEIKDCKGVTQSMVGTDCKNGCDETNGKCKSLPDCVVNGVNVKPGQKYCDTASKKIGTCGIIEDTITEMSWSASPCPNGCTNGAYGVDALCNPGP